MYLQYQPHLPYVLRNLNVNINAGAKIGIIGRTGAGKSSIVQALFRLIEPDCGTIIIDGQNYLYAGLHDLRDQMSVIPQFPFIFQGSLR